MSKTITISMSEGDLAKIDAYCTMHELTRSKFFVQAVLEKVDFSNLVDSMVLLNGYLDKMDRGDVLAPEERRLLSEVARYYSGEGKLDGK